MQRSGYCSDGVYRSLRPSLVLPKHPNLSLVAHLFSKVSSFPANPALFDADTSHTLSFSHLKSLTVRVSHGLLRLGIAKNDVVLFLSPNTIYYPVCFLAVTALGAVASTVNPSYTAAEVSKQVKDSNPKLVITVQELWDKVKAFNLPAVFLGSNPTVHVAAPGSKITSFEELVKLAGESPTEFPVNNVGQSDTAALLYSSGTTGVSKGVVLTHGNFIAAATMICMDDELAGQLHDVFLCVLPMFHVFGLAVICYAQLQRGSAVVCLKRFEFDVLLRTIEKYKVSHLWVVPPIVLALAKHGLVDKFDLSSLRHIGSGAAPLGKELMEECSKRFPNALVCQVIQLLVWPLATQGA